MRAGLGDVAGGREGEVIALHQHAVDGRADRAPSCGSRPPSGRRCRMTPCQSGLRRNRYGLLVTSPSTSIDWLPDATMNDVCPGVWPCVAIEVIPGTSSLPGSNLFTLSSMILEHAPHIEPDRTRGLGRLAHVGVVHPVRPFGRRHMDLGIREHEPAVLVAQPVDVVGMEVRDQDRCRRSSGRCPLPRGWPCSCRTAPATGRRCAVSIITSFEPVLTTSGVNGVGTVSGGMKALAIAFSTSGPCRIADEVVVDLAHPDAVMDRGQLERTDLVAVERGRLLAGDGRGGLRRYGKRRGRGGERRTGQADRGG